MQLVQFNENGQGLMDTEHEIPPVVFFTQSHDSFVVADFWRDLTWFYCWQVEKGHSEKQNVFHFDTCGLVSKEMFLYMIFN